MFKKITLGLFAVMVICVFMGGSAGAVVPGLMNYQGKLTDSNNVPAADATRTFVFGLYDVSSGGTALWTESRSISTEAGFFNVILGETSSIPSSVFTREGVYLGVKVDTDAEMTPRQRIVSAGYAFNAGMLEGHDSSYFATSADMGDYVLKAGDTMTGTLTVETSASIGIYGSGETGIYGYSDWAASGEGVVGEGYYGVFGTDDYKGPLAGLSGTYGVIGAADTGVYGLSTATSNGIGVSGSGDIGVQGAGDVTGVYGLSATQYSEGVRGEATYGVVGLGTEGSGVPRYTDYLNNGVYGVIGAGDTGVYGYGSPVSGTTEVYGVYGTRGAGKSFGFISGTKEGTDIGVYGGDGTGFIASKKPAKIGVVGASTGGGVYGSNGQRAGALAFGTDAVAGWNEAATTEGALGGSDYGAYGYADGANKSAVVGYQDNASGYSANFQGGKNYFEGRVGIGTLEPASKLTVNGTIETTLGGYKFADGTIQTTAAAPGNYVLKAGDTMTGNLTIESANLNITKTGSLLYSLAEGEFSLYKTSAGSVKIRSIAGRGLNLESATDQHITLTPLGAGNVGIGTAEPTQKLHIKSSGTDKWPLYIEASDGSQLAGIYENAGGASYFALKDAAGTNQVFLYSAGSSYITGGNTAIGTITATSKLTVAGTIEMTSGSGGGLKFPDSTIQTTAAISGITTADADDRYVNEAGDTMTGVLTTGAQIVSTVATGTAPFSIASTTKVTNLNADFLDGHDSTYFLTQEVADARYVNVLGDTMTGTLTISASASQSLRITDISTAGGSAITIRRPGDLAGRNMIYAEHGSRIVTLAGDEYAATFVGDVLAYGNTTLEGNTHITGESGNFLTIGVSIDSDVVPDGDLTRDMGKPDKKWVFYGDGSNLTGIATSGALNAYVLKAGDTMTGTLTMDAGAFRSNVGASAVGFELRTNNDLSGGSGNLFSIYNGSTATQSAVSFLQGNAGGNNYNGIALSGISGSKPLYLLTGDFSGNKIIKITDGDDHGIDINDINGEMVVHADLLTLRADSNVLTLEGNSIHVRATSSFEAAGTDSKVELADPSWAGYFYNQTTWAGYFDGLVNVTGSMAADTYYGDGSNLTGVATSGALNAYVLKTGDTMTGKLTITTGESIGLSSTTAINQYGRAVYGYAEGTGDNNVGGYFVANGGTAQGVYGYAMAATGESYGGYFSSNSSLGTGVFGYSILRGVYGWANGASGKAVEGYSQFASGTNYAGYFNGDSSSGYGVWTQSPGTAFVATNEAGTHYSAALATPSWAGYFSGPVNVTGTMTASSYYGNGQYLTNVATTGALTAYVLKTGDTMTGVLTMAAGVIKSNVADASAATGFTLRTNNVIDTINGVDYTPDSSLFSIYNGAAAADKTFSVYEIFGATDLKYRGIHIPSYEGSGDFHILGGSLLGESYFSVGNIFAGNDIKFKNDGGIVLNADLTETKGLSPNQDNARDLGQVDKRWANIYAVNYYGDGSNLTGILSSAEADSRYLRKTGGRMSGPLTMEAGVSLFANDSSVYAQSVYVGSQLTNDGGTNLNGTVWLGNDSGDSIMFGGRVDSDIIPRSEPDIGSPEARFGDIYANMFHGNGSNLTGVATEGSYIKLGPSATQTTAALRGISVESSAYQGAGVYSVSSGQYGYGVYGISTDTHANIPHYGGYFTANSGRGRGIYAEATDSSASDNYGGVFFAGGTGGYGIRAEATGAGSNYVNYGGYFSASGGSGEAVHATALWNSGLNYAGYFDGSSSAGYGVWTQSPGTALVATNEAGTHYSAILANPSWAGYFNGPVNITGNLNVTGVATASAFYGDGSNLTGVVTSGALNAYVLKTGDTMTGTLTNTASAYFATSTSPLINLVIGTTESGGEKLKIKSATNVGMEIDGTNVAVIRLKKAGTTKWSLMSESLSDRFTIYNEAASATSFTINQLGRVGIGSTAWNPQQQLSVSGTIEITSGSGGGLKFADGTIQTTAASGGNYVILGPANTQSTTSATAINVKSEAASGKGISAEASGSGGVAVYGVGQLGGVYGKDSDSNAYGYLGFLDYGVMGISDVNNGYGGKFDCSGLNGYGVYGSANNGIAIYGVGKNGGVYGKDSDSNAYGYLGFLEYGVMGISDVNNGYGGYFSATSTEGQNYGGYFDVNSSAGYGVWTQSPGTALVATNEAGTHYSAELATPTWAGYFNGPVNINGNLNVTGVATASAFYGNGSNLTGIQTGITTADADGRYVNITGDTMNGTLTYEGSSAYGIRSVTSNTLGRGVYGYASQESSINYGGYFETASSNGRGIYGAANSTTAGYSYGGYFTHKSYYFGAALLATSEVAGEAGNYAKLGAYDWAGYFKGPVNVVGSMTATASYYGDGSHLTGIPNGTYVDFGPIAVQQTTEAKAIWVRSTAASGEGIRAEGNGSYGIGVYGYSGTVDGTGVYGKSLSNIGHVAGPDYGVYGQAGVSASPAKYGYIGGYDAVYGQSSSSIKGSLGAPAYGVYGENATNYKGWLGAADCGAHGQFTSTTYGKLGANITSGSYPGNYGAYARSGSFNYAMLAASQEGVIGISGQLSGIGVLGRATASGGDSASGGYFYSHGYKGIGAYAVADASYGIGVIGRSTTTEAAITAGGSFESYSTIGWGVVGIAKGSGAGRGVYGLATGPNAYGVYGQTSISGWGGYFTGGSGLYASIMHINDSSAVPAYNTIGANRTSHAMSASANNLMITGSLEVDGRAFFDGGHADVAELISIEGQAEAGDVLAVSINFDERAKKCDKPYDPSIIGVISESPSMLISGGMNEEDGQPIALAGRVQTKVCLEGGPIRRGDLLTSSSIPGHAMKATKAGTIVGKALQNFDGSKGQRGKIWVFVTVGWHGGESEE